MNKKLITGLTTAAMVMSMSGMMVFADEMPAEADLGVAINAENFPDEHFAEAIANKCDKNKDGYLSEEEIANTTELCIASNQITSLEGIKYFTNISFLDCGNNDIDSIDLSGNTTLTTLGCDCDNLTSLNLSGCTSLNFLECCQNPISDLNITGCTSLEYLICQVDNLTSLDLSTNTALKGLCCAGNQLSTINIANNPLLLEAYSEGSYSMNMDVYSITLHGKTYSPEEKQNNPDAYIAFYLSDSNRVYTTMDIILTDADTVIETCNPTPAAEPTSTPAPTTTPAATPAPKSDMVSFAERLYTKALGRNYDKAGRDYWVAQMKSGMTGTEVAKRFFFSDEYMNANHNDADFVATLYRTFMNREYDQAGFDFWMNEIANGCSRENILIRFAACPEFANICANAGIAR